MVFETGLLLKTRLLLCAALVCCSGSSSFSIPVFSYALPAGPGPAGVHGPGSAHTLPRVGPRQAPTQPAPRGRDCRRAKLEKKGMGEGGWD